MLYVFIAYATFHSRENFVAFCETTSFFFNVYEWMQIAAFSWLRSYK